MHTKTHIEEILGKNPRLQSADCPGEGGRQPSKHVVALAPFPWIEAEGKNMPGKRLITAFFPVGISEPLFGLKSNYGVVIWSDPHSSAS